MLSSRSISAPAWMPLGAMSLLSLTKVCLILILWCIDICDGSKLNVPRVLLPYNHEYPTNFTLKVYEGGCYQWSCSRDELVLLREVIGDDGCANEVQVSAISRSPTRQTAIILAQDTGGVGGVLRCDVLIDTIHRLEIVTTTRELYVEEAPEEFEVRAYDDQGNEFSTLEGVSMIWDLQTLTDRESVVAAQTVLRFMTFRESPYETPPAIAPLEDAGQRGYMVLVEGRQTGSARLSVRLAHPAYQHIEPAWVDLMVVANLLLEPADVTLLPHTTITYTVYQLKQGHLSTINLPSSQFYLQVVNTDVAELESDGISVEGKTLGNTQVILRDKNVDESSSWVKQPSAFVRVVEPSYLVLNVVAPYSGNMVTGRHYALHATAFDAHHNRITITENVVMETTVPGEYFTPELVTKNGSYIYGVPIKEGNTIATATLSAVETDNGILEISPPLTASLDLAIYPPLSVVPALTVLPWDPLTTPTYTLNLTAVGGSGGVSWSSSRGDIVSVTGNGICYTKTTGAATITASSTIDPHNKDTAQIHILEAIGLSLVPGEVEAEVDEHLGLHIASHTTNTEGYNVPFTNCHQLPLTVEPADVSFTPLPDVVAPSVAKSCAMVEVVGKSPGFTTVKVSYHTSRGQLEVSTLVAAYRPLVPLNPASGETVLAVGSSRVVVFQGGPLPWPSHKPNMHSVSVVVGGGDIFEAKLVDGKKVGSLGDIHGVEVVCLRVGEASLNITVTNTPSAALPFPRKASGGVRVVCGVPDSLSLVALTRRPAIATAPCPTHDSPAAIAHCHKPLNLEVVVEDYEGRRFDNISSLSIRWSVSDTTLASTPQQNLPSLAQVASVHGLSVPVITYQVIEPAGEVGEVTVTATLTVTGNGYNDVPSLSTSLLIRLVNDAVMDPQTAILYHHHDNKLDVKVTGGSGHFELQTPTSDIVDLTYRPQDGIVSVRPLSDGEVTVILVDLCLEADAPPSTHITVASIAALDINVLECVEVGGSLEAEVVARTSTGATLPSHNLMALTAHPLHPIIATTFKGSNKAGNAIYEVKGRHIGDTSLKVSAAGAGGVEAERVYSPSRPIQVFPPLTLHPRNITLVVGAVYQVTTQGGPYPDAVVEFSVVDEGVATASHTGLVTAAALGTTTLTAAARTQHRDARRLVYSKDTVIINVVPLEKIRIYAPLRQLEAGTSMPLYAIGRDTPYQGPPAYATALPPLNFHWSLSDNKAASLVGLYAENSIEESPENQGIVRLRALRSGRVTISLKVEATSPALNTQRQLQSSPLMDKLEIKIFEPLKLKNPSGLTSQLLLTPNSEAKILTNRDGDATLSYHVENEGDGIVTVSDGVVISGAKLGKAVVIVTVSEAHGVTQSISVLVEVKKVRYLQLSVGAVMKSRAGREGPDGVLTHVPIGSTLPVSVSRHDDRGRTFHATNTHPAIASSRSDLVAVRGADNSSLVMSVWGRGQTVLQVWDITGAATTPMAPPSHTSSAYLRINSGPAIFPDRVVVPQGSHVCFSSIIGGVSDEVGLWGNGKIDESGEITADSRMLTVDPQTGVGVCHRPGTTTVSYKLGSAIATTTEVTILPITRISLRTLTHPLTNGVDGDWQVAYVDLGCDGCTPTPCLPSQPPTSHPPFTCRLNVGNKHPDLDTSELFHVTPVYVSQKGYGCQVRSIGGPHPQLSTWAPGLEVEAAVGGVGVGEGVSSKVGVTFLPAPILEVTQVTLSLDQPSVDIVVRGVPQVLAALQIPSAVGGVEVALGGAAYDDTRTVTVLGREAAWTAPDPLPSPLTISIKSPLTRDSLLQINVTIEEGEGCVVRGDPGLLAAVVSLVTHYDRAILYFFCIALTIACVVIGYHALLGPGYKQTRQTGVFANSPAPPPPLSPFSSVSGSPGSPSAATPPPVTSPSPHRPALWSVSNEPVYGAAQYRRGAYQGSPTYTPTK